MLKKGFFLKVNFKIILFFLLVFVVFFLLRIVNLTTLPVFADEAIYIRWAQVMKAEPTLRFLPLSDGKQPFFMWILMGFLKVFKDPLFVGRALSVFSGLGTLLGLFLLVVDLFKDKKQAFLAAIFYSIIPIFVFFDRMALVDSMLLMFLVWTFYLGLLFAKTLRLDIAMVLGILLGLSLLTKSPAIFAVFLLPLGLILFPIKNLFQKLKKSKFLLKFLGKWLVVYCFGFAIFNILRLGPNFHMMALRNKDYLFSFSEVLSHPLDPLKPHIFDLFSWLPNLLTLPILLLSVFGILLMILNKKERSKAVWLLALFLIPLFAESFIAKVFTPRYILFTLWPLLVFASFSARFFIEKAKNSKVLVLGFAFLVLIFSLRYDYLLLSNPQKAPLPEKMRSGYLEEWSSGYGIKEASAIIKKEAQDKNVLVGTEGFFGTLPDGLQIYLEGVPNITVVGVGYPVMEVSEKLINSLVDNQVYLLVNQSRLQIEPTSNGLELVEEYPKAKTKTGAQDKLLFFKLNKDFWSNK